MAVGLIFLQEIPLKIFKNTINKFLNFKDFVRSLSRFLRVAINNKYHKDVK
jgi:hypothetical protein